MNKGVEQIVSWSAVIDGVLSFIAVQDGEYYFRESIAEFKDINDHWAKEYIEFTHTHELFKGVGNGLFNPDGKMTRAMFVTVLGRLHGVDPGMYGASSLNDVKNGQWYSPFVEWAYRNNIVLGDGKGSFNPDMGITRQEMCVILERYTKFAGLSLTETVDKKNFHDEDKVSSWARSSVEFVQRTGLMQGDNNNFFNPGDFTTRAEVATVFKNFILKVLESLFGLT
jgi:hypothetical protein